MADAAIADVPVLQGPLYDGGLERADPFAGKADPGSEADLDDAEWQIIADLLPRNWRGLRRVDDRPVLNGIFWRFRTSSPWIAMPARYGPPTTCYSRYVRWRRLGVWTRLLAALGGTRRELVAMAGVSAKPTHSPLRCPECGRRVIGKRNLTEGEYDGP